MPSEKTVLGNVKVVCGPERTREGLWDIVLANGRIEALLPAGDVREGQRIDGAGLIAAPGFIDLHVHGGMGADFMDTTEEAFRTIAAYHAQGGTTSYLATTTSESLAEIVAVLELASRCREQRLGDVEILGVHAEGPYFHPRMHGCHTPGKVRPPSAEENKAFLDRAHILRRMTLAPELPGALDFIEEATRAGIVCSGGHSTATLPEVMRAVDRGMSMTTHLYCAMSSITKSGPRRIPGMLEATLLDDRISTEIIADLRHVCPELMRLALKAKAPGTVAFTTDAMRGAGMPDGQYTFGPRHGTPAIVENGIAHNLENTGYASSTVQMIDLVRNGVEALGMSVEAAVRHASTIPARIAGVSASKGSLEPGKDADIVLLATAPRLKVAHVFVRGKPIRTN